MSSGESGTYLFSTWFRDYLYIPLGGSKQGNGYRLNIFIIFLVSGFWHGANWTFIFWGLFHSILFTISFLFNTNRKYKYSILGENKLLPSPIEFLKVLSTFFFFVTIGWIFFRSDTISGSFDYLNKIISNPFLSDPTFPIVKNVLLIGMFLILDYIVLHLSFSKRIT